MNTWTKLLNEAVNGETDKIPKGFRTQEQIGKQWNLENRQVRRRLKQLLSAGKIERQMFKVKINGTIIRQPHYRPKGIK